MILFVASAARLADCLAFRPMIAIQRLSAVPAIVGGGSAVVIHFSTASSS